MKTSTVSELAGTVTETVTDAVSSGVDVALDVAGTIASRAPDVAEAVSRQAAGLAERVGSTRRRNWQPWVVVAVVVLVTVFGVRFMKRRRSSTPESSVNDLRAHTERARSAAS